MGVWGVIVLGASPGEISAILAGTAAGYEVIIHTFGAMGVGMLMLLAFLTCREHLLWIPSLSLVYRADIQVAGLASGKSGVFCIQNCLLAFLHVWNWSSNISMVPVSSGVMPKYVFLCHNIMSNFHEVYPCWKLHTPLFPVHDPVSACLSIIETLHLWLRCVSVEM